MSHDELLTADEVAERLHTTTRFVRRLIAERRIPFVKLGKFVRISTADLDRYVAASRVESRVPQFATTVRPVATWRR